MDHRTDAPKRPRAERQGVEQALPEEQAGLSREPVRDETTIAHPQRRGVAETGEDEDLPDPGSVEGGPGALRSREP